MNEKQQRIIIQESVMQLVNSFMLQNNISAAEMEDALSKVMIQLKDRVLVDVVTEHLAAQEQPEEEQPVVEEEPLVTIEEDE